MSTLLKKRPLASAWLLSAAHSDGKPVPGGVTAFPHRLTALNEIAPEVVQDLQCCWASFVTNKTHTNLYTLISK
jgi:hypothetical protein